jgi:hypothetical protein
MNSTYRWIVLAGALLLAIAVGFWAYQAGVVANGIEQSGTFVTGPWRISETRGRVSGSRAPKTSLYTGQGSSGAEPTPRGGDWPPFRLIARCSASSAASKR